MEKLKKIAIDELRRWIKVQSNNENYSDTENLLANNILTSVQFFNLIYYVEDLRGVIIQDEELVPEKIYCLNEIYENLLAPHMHED